MTYIISNSSKPTKKDKKEIENISNLNYITHNGKLTRKFTFNQFNKEDIMVMIKENGICIGFAFLQAFNGTLYISQMAISPTYQNKYLENYLISYIRCHSEGYNSISTHVNIKNKDLLSLFYKNGFEIADKHGDNYFLKSEIPQTLERTNFKKNITQKILTLDPTNDIEL